MPSDVPLNVVVGETAYDELFGEPDNRSIISLHLSAGRAARAR